MFSFYILLRSLLFTRNKFPFSRRVSVAQFSSRTKGPSPPHQHHLTLVTNNSHNHNSCSINHSNSNNYRQPFHETPPLESFPSRRNSSSGSSNLPLFIPLHPNFLHPSAVACLEYHHPQHLRRNPILRSCPPHFSSTPELAKGSDPKT